MKRLKVAGCTRYDLWGAPDGLQEDDPLWGVYRFKEGLGGVVVRSSGAWDLPIRPSLYRFYTQALPRLLDVMRKRGKERTKQAVNAV
jgi:lipid II:glycine glycyltransferase (peptidoglycan interpeptide bridge formation enzyme)